MSPFLIHIHGTMPLGKVTDAGGEAKDVSRLFVADHSVIPNALGGQNPTHTGQALALRTADHIDERYPSSDTGGTGGTSGVWGSGSSGSSGSSSSGSGGWWGSGGSSGSGSSGSSSSGSGGLWSSSDSGSSDSSGSTGWWS
jgi:hypothetical protein